jgi:hypothetical protein
MHHKCGHIAGTSVELIDCVRVLWILGSLKEPVAKLVACTCDKWLEIGLDAEAMVLFFTNKNIPTKM